uniref:Uncharacterized protein n=1 Tax=Marmota marmota marmota TaxID=9994 RepID=A0A8C5YTE4_MARMA
KTSFLSLPHSPQGTQAGPHSPAALKRGPRVPSWGHPAQPAERSPWVCGPLRWGAKRRLRIAAAAQPGPRSRWHRHCAVVYGAYAQLPGGQPRPLGGAVPQPHAVGCCPGPQLQRKLRSALSPPGWCAGPLWHLSVGKEPRAPPGHALPPRAGASPHSPWLLSSRLLLPPAAAWHTWKQECKGPRSGLRA